MEQWYGGYFESQYSSFPGRDSSFVGRSSQYLGLYSIYYDIFNDIPRNWRQDAKFFLLLNVMELVVKPYISHHLQMSDDEYANFRELVLNDLNRIVETSQAIAKERNKSYTSATSVAVALGRLAPDLKTTSLQVWGPKENE